MVNQSGIIELNSFHGFDSLSCNWTLVAPKPGRYTLLFA